MINPRRLGHFNLYVSNLEAATHFYQDVCGIRYIAAEPHVPIRFLTNGSSHHELGLIEIHVGNRIGRDGFVQGTTKPNQKPGLNHLGWEMESEAALVEAYRRLQNAGLEMRLADHTIAHSVYVADPDGNHHEFFADTPFDWPQLLRGDLPPLTGQWDPEAQPPVTEGHYPRNPSVDAVEHAPVHPVKPSHGVLCTNDLQGMREFFAKTVGLDELMASPADGFAMFKGAATHGVADLILIEGRKDGQGALHHMAFAMPNEQEVDRSLERLMKLGYKPLRTFDSEHKCGFVLSDPDGLLVEFAAQRRAGGMVRSRDVYELA